MKRQGILVTLILIAIVAVAGGFTVYRMKKNAIVPVTTVSPSTTTTAVTPTPGSGSSDADLEKDTLGIDTKLKTLNTDASGIDQSLNDQQGNLSEQ